MYFELDEIAEKLQDEINSFICLIQESKSVIWDKCAPSSLYELKVSELGAFMNFYDDDLYLTHLFRKNRDIHHHKFMK
jgi:hypothetical protein